MKATALFSIKGGVGKTAAAVNLAHLAARGGARTLLWDLDPQGAASFYLRIRPKLAGGSKRLLKRKNRLAEAIKASDFAGLDVIPADVSLRDMVLALNDLGDPPARLRRLLRPLREHYDLVFIDCAPGVSLVSDSVMRTSDLVLVPTIPTTLSLRAHAQLLAHAKAKGFDAAIVPFFSMADRRRRLHRDVMVEFASRTPECSRIFIPYATQVEMMGLRRLPVTGFAPASAPARAFEQLWDHVARRLGAAVQGRRPGTGPATADKTSVDVTSANE